MLWWFCDTQNHHNTITALRIAYFVYVKYGTRTPLGLDHKTFLCERGMIFSPERDEFINDVRFQLRLSLTLSEALSHVVAFCFGSCPYDMVRGYDTCGSWFLSGPMIWFSQVINLFCLAFPNKRLPSAYLSPHSSPLTTNPLCLCSCHSSPRFAPVCYCLLLCVLLVFDFAILGHILCH